jgi:hypothetical protein
MKLIPILPFVVGLLTSACATAPYREAKEISLKNAILLASRDLTDAAEQIEKHPKTYRTFGLRPTKATVSFDLSSIRGEGNTAQLTVGVPNVPVTGGFGWSASRQIQKGNHIEIDFTRP